MSSEPSITALIIVASNKEQGESDQFLACKFISVNLY